MTYIEAQKLIDHEQKQKYYCTSPLNYGKVDIIRVGEDGFIYSRETEHVKVAGIAELLCDKFTVDIDRWCFSEVVVVRKENEHGKIE